MNASLRKPTSCFELYYKSGWAPAMYPELRGDRTMGCRLCRVLPPVIRFHGHASPHRSTSESLVLASSKILAFDNSKQTLERA